MAGPCQTRGDRGREVSLQGVQQGVPPPSQHKPGAHTILSVQGGNILF